MRVDAAAFTELFGVDSFILNKVKLKKGSFYKVLPVVKIPPHYLRPAAAPLCALPARTRASLYCIYKSECPRVALCLPGFTVYIIICTWQFIHVDAHGGTVRSIHDAAGSRQQRVHLYFTRDLHELNETGFSYMYRVIKWL